MFTCERERERERERESSIDIYQVIIANLMTVNHFRRPIDGKQTSLNIN